MTVLEFWTTCKCFFKEHYFQYKVVQTKQKQMCCPSIEFVGHLYNASIPLLQYSKTTTMHAAS